LNTLRELVSKTNIYINSRSKLLNINLVENIAQWVGRMLRMFGLGEGERTEFGWGHADQGSKNTDVGSFLTRYHFHPSSYVQREEVLMPYLGVLSSFRDGIRQLAMSKGENNLKDILTMCDKLRDDDLVPLGVALDDQDGGVLRFFLLLLLTNHHN